MVVTKCKPVNVVAAYIYIYNYKKDKKNSVCMYVCMYIKDKGKKKKGPKVKP